MLLGKEDGYLSEDFMALKLERQQLRLVINAIEYESSRHGYKLSGD